MTQVKALQSPNRDHGAKHDAELRFIPLRGVADRYHGPYPVANAEDQALQLSRRFAA